MRSWKRKDISMLHSKDLNFITYLFWPSSLSSPPGVKSMCISGPTKVQGQENTIRICFFLLPDFTWYLCFINLYQSFSEVGIQSLHSISGLSTNWAWIYWGSTFIEYCSISQSKWLWSLAVNLEIKAKS